MLNIRFDIAPLPEQHLTQLVETVTDLTTLPERVGHNFATVQAAYDSLGVPQGRSIAWYHHEAGALVFGVGFDTTLADPVPVGLESGTLATCERALIAHCIGGVHEMAQAWQAVMAEVNRLGEQPGTQAAREVYLATPVDRPGEWVFEVQYPLATPDGE